MLLSVSSSAAELSESVTRLRDEPMSMFDWGMYKLERELQQVRRDERDFVRASYESKNKRIIVDASFVVVPEEIAAKSARVNSSMQRSSASNYSIQN